MMVLMNFNPPPSYFLHTLYLANSIISSWSNETCIQTDCLRKIKMYSSLVKNYILILLTNI